MGERYFLVLLEEEILCPVSYVRVVHHLSYAPPGWRFSICVLPREAELAGTLLDQISGVLVARAVSPAAAAITKAARKRGLPVVYDLDDFLWRLPEYVGARDLASGADAVLQNATHLLSPSVPLMRFVQERFPHVTASIVANAGDLIVRHRERTGITAVMANSDFFRLPALKREFFGALRSAADEVGVKLWLYYLSNDVPEDYTDDPALQVIWAGVRSYSAYRALLDHVRPELGLVPLPADHFSQYKSVVKFAEFGHHGIAGVFSRVQPYLGFVEDGVDGWLTDNTAEGWKTTMRQVLSAPAARRREVSAHARARAQNEFPAAIWRNEFFEALKGTGAGPVSAPAISPNPPPVRAEFTFRPAYDYIASLRDGLTHQRDEARARVQSLEQEITRLKARNSEPQVAEGAPSSDL